MQCNAYRLSMCTARPEPVQLTTSMKCHIPLEVSQNCQGAVEKAKFYWNRWNPCLQSAQDSTRTRELRPRARVQAALSCNGLDALKHRASGGEVRHRGSRHTRRCPRRRQRRRPRRCSHSQRCRRRCRRWSRAWRRWCTWRWPAHNGHTRSRRW